MKTHATSTTEIAALWAKTNLVDKLSLAKMRIGAVQDRGNSIEISGIAKAGKDDYSVTVSMDKKHHEFSLEFHPYNEAKATQPPRLMTEAEKQDFRTAFAAETSHNGSYARAESKLVLAHLAAKMQHPK